jgi:hypothetical protein
LIASALILAIVLLILLLTNQLNTTVSRVEASTNEEFKEPVHTLQVTEFIHCSKRCFEMYENVTTENGWMECENIFIWLECHRGFIPSAEESFVCQDFNA